MGEGALGLLGVTLAAAVGELVLPVREGGGLRRLFRLLVVLAVLLLLLRPLSGALSELQGLWEEGLPPIGGEAQDFEGVLQEAVRAQSAIDLEAGLCALLQAELGLREGALAVRVRLDGAGELEAVTVRLSGAGLLQDPQAIEKRVEELLHCAVEVR